MSRFDELDDSAKIERLRHLARASFQMSVSSLAILINRGLVSPDEFSTLMNPVLDTFHSVDGGSDDELAQIYEKFAKLKSLAAQTWKQA